MTKANLTAELASKAHITKKEASDVIDAFFEVITEALSNGEKIQITGFGTFEVRNREARKGRNPSTGEEIDIPASKLPTFKAGKALKEAVNS